MNELQHKIGFIPADILLPKTNNMASWSVVACDQYTSQPEYWERVERAVGNQPSTLRLVFPESRLGSAGEQENIAQINATMKAYLKEGVFRTVPASYIYVERTQANGKVRRGVVGAVDLEQYDYHPGASALIRATEGTVLERIPPRVAVRRDAPLEATHIMLLIDDPMRTAIEPLGGEKDRMEKLYDFTLMEGGGHIAGWKVSGEQEARLTRALWSLTEPAAFKEKYHMPDAPVLLFAVGDGNHSLATAKECYERQKQSTPPEQWASLPSRYALTEVVNLHDGSLEFEPIHRVVFGVDPADVLRKLKNRYPGATEGPGEGQAIGFVYGEREGVVTIPNSKAKLAVGTLQSFLDEYTKEHGGRIDYIHGSDITRELGKKSANIGFLLPTMRKSQLFPIVMADGVLPRKTFSMGEAWDKRYYLECRKIR